MQKYKIKQPKKHHIMNQQNKITTLLKTHLQKQNQYPFALHSR